jgi:hypothetical protein
MSRPGEVDPELRAAALDAFFAEQPEPAITYAEADRRLSSALGATMQTLRAKAGLADRPDDLPDPRDSR